MAVGLQVFDALNNTIYDISKNMTRSLGIYTLTGSGSINLTDFNVSGRLLFFIFIDRPSYRPQYLPEDDVGISVTSTSITWVNLPNNNTEGRVAKVLLGVY